MDIIQGSDKRMVILINKTDQYGPDLINSLRSGITVGEDDTLLFISAREKTGLPDLKKALASIIEKERLNSGDIIITNLRHYEALKNVSESLGRVIDGLSSHIPEDLIAIDIRQAIHYLGEITGEITTDEILGNIFRNFCIGK